MTQESAAKLTHTKAPAVVYVDSGRLHQRRQHLCLHRQIRRSIFNSATGFSGGDYPDLSFISSREAIAGFLLRVFQPGSTAAHDAAIGAPVLASDTLK